MQQATLAQGRQDGLFAADADAGHSLRVVARAVALAQVNETRADAEGIGSIDLEAQSDPAWKLWRQRLSPRDRGDLAVVRGGAVKTKTRRFWNHGRAFCASASAAAPEGRLGIFSKNVLGFSPFGPVCKLVIACLQPFGNSSRGAPARVGGLPSMLPLVKGSVSACR